MIDFGQILNQFNHTEEPDANEEAERTTNIRHDRDASYLGRLTDSYVAQVRVGYTEHKRVIRVKGRQIVADHTLEFNRGTFLGTLKLTFGIKPF